MSDSGTCLSFDITTPEQFMEKLKDEQRSLEGDLTSACHAINAAMTAWHLIEWVWGLAVKGHLEVRRKLGKDSKNFNTFRAFLLRECPELETMQCISEGSKHLGTDNAAVDETFTHGGDLGDRFGKAYNISRLHVKKNDGTIACFDNELEAAVNFWEHFIATYLH